MRAARVFLGLALAAAGAAGCHDFHYYDVHVTLNGDPANGGFNTGSEVTKLQVGTLSVSGADSGSMPLGPNMQGLPLTAGHTDVGIFEFSTFTDSGQLVFKFQAYDDSVRSANCLAAEGTATVSASATTTNMVDLKANRTANAFMDQTCAGAM
jgi:hypothetical protein